MNIFDVVHSEWSKLRDKVQSEQIQANVSDALKSGLKSKTERLLNLQNQIEDIQNKLDENINPDYFVISGEVQKVNKEISVTDRAYLQKVMKELQSEISKIEGDYAPTKMADTDKDGNDRLPERIIIKVISGGQKQRNSEEDVIDERS